MSISLESPFVYSDFSDNDIPQYNNVAISGNGQRIIWGSTNYPPDGAVFVADVTDASISNIRTYTEFSSGNARGGSAVDANYDGTRFIWGAWLDDASGSQSGAIYIGSISGDDLVCDASYDSFNASDTAGLAVAISGNGEKSIWGAHNASLGNGRVFIADISSGDGSISNVLTFDNFTPGARGGYAVDVTHDGSRFIWSAYNDDTSGNFAGAIYIGGISGGAIVVDDSYTEFAADDNAGTSVAISGNGTRAIWGAPGTDKGGNVNNGRVYVADISNNGSISNVLSFDDFTTGDAYGGNSVDVNFDGTVFIWGAHNDDSSGSQSGAVYVGSITDDSLVANAFFDSFVASAHGGRSVATDDAGATFLWNSEVGSTGSIYLIVPVDADGDGIFEPTDIFLNQQLNVVPTAIPQLANVFAIAPGKHHTLAITRDGRVLSFGRNQSGQLGRLVTDVSGHVPADVSGASNGYAATEARARLAGGDVYSPADAYADRRRRDALVGLLEAFNGALTGEAGYNEELFRAQLAKLRKQ